MSGPFLVLSRLAVATAYHPDDVAAAGRFAGPLRRHQFLEGRRLARMLLPPDAQIGIGPGGRPEVTGGDAWDLSISHSRDWAAAAVVSGGRVGIDVETPRSGHAAQGIARRFFSVEEQRMVDQRGEPALLALWTMREAVSKLCSDGIVEALNMDGSLLVSAWNSTCSGWSANHRWVLAHRETDTVQFCLAWAPPTSFSSERAMNLVSSAVAAAQVL